VVWQPVPQQAGVLHSHPSVFGAVAELQSADPALHVYEHVAPLQVADCAFVRLHLSPHALQLFVVLSEVHVEPHSVSAHVQAPFEQSGFGCAQGVQFAPPVPQDVADCPEYGSHTLPLQQPFGQEVASQTHCPVVLLHSRPIGHCVHVAPFAPHDWVDSAESGSHVPALQQPAHGLPEPQLQVPPVHVSPVPQVPHAAPPLPHALDV
jgi:hypothetical protein